MFFLQQFTKNTNKLNFTCRKISKLSWQKWCYQIVSSSSVKENMQRSTALLGATPRSHSQHVLYDPLISSTCVCFYQSRKAGKSFRSSAQSLSYPYSKTLSSQHLAPKCLVIFYQFGNYRMIRGSEKQFILLTRFKI